MAWGGAGVLVAAIAVLVALVAGPACVWRLTLRRYGADPIPPSRAPGLWRTLRVLAERAGLPALPTLHDVPSPVVNAFVVRRVPLWRLGGCWR
jgi:heat shock protein HtpX